MTSHRIHTKFYVLRSYDTGYGHEIRRYHVPRREFTHDVVSGRYIGGVVSTQVTNPTRLWPFKSRAKHVAVLDCDSEDAMLAAAHWIKTEYGVAYTPIESSPGHYWLVTDLVGTIDHLIYQMHEIPGIDPKFIDLCRRQRMISVRVHPKVCEGETIQLRSPKFRPDSALTNPLAKGWYNAFVSYFDSPDYKKICKAIMLRESIKLGCVTTMAADPAFQV